MLACYASVLTGVPLAAPPQDVASAQPYPCRYGTPPLARVAEDCQVARLIYCHGKASERGTCVVLNRDVAYVAWTETDPAEHPDGRETPTVFMNSAAHRSQFSRHRLQFSLGSVFAAAAVAAILLAWWMDHRALQEQIVRLKGPHLLGHFPQRDPAILNTGANAFVAFRDGSGVLCANGKSAELWEMVHGRKLLSLDHPEPIVDMALSPDEKFLITLTGGSDSPVRLWSLESGELVKEYPSPFSRATAKQSPWVWTIWTPGSPPTCGFTSVAFSANGRTFATGCDDGTIILWDTKSGDKVRRVNGNAGRIRSIVFAPDGARILTASQDQVVQLWDVETESLTTEYRHEQKNSRREPPLPIAFSPDGTMFAFCFNQSLEPVYVCDADSGEKMPRFRADSHHCHHITFLPDKTALVTCSGGVLRLRQLTTGKEILNHRCRLRYCGDLSAGVRYVQYLPAISSVMVAGVVNDEQTLHEDWTIIQIVPLSSLRIPENR